MNPWIGIAIGLGIGFVLGCFGGQSLTYGNLTRNLLDSLNKVLKDTGNRLEVGQSMIFTITVGKFLNEDDDDGGGDGVPVDPIVEESWRLN